MRFQGAVIQEQGVTFGIVIVQEHILNEPTRRDALVSEGSRLFGGIPTVLMAQDFQGSPTYYGRSDISRFMASVPLEAVRWKEYTVSI
jgi:hypothetical protein